jgi:monoamine oxidase
VTTWATCRPAATALAEAMGEGVEVRLGQMVEEVTLRPRSVRVRTAAGLEEECSHVVVTVPLAVLRQGGIAFDPPLPPERVGAIDRLGFGSYEKVAMLFEEPFWRAEGIAHLLVLPSRSDPWTPWLVGLDAFNAGPILVAHTGGRSAERLNDMSPGRGCCSPARPDRRGDPRSGPRTHGRHPDGVGRRPICRRLLHESASRREQP